MNFRLAVFILATIVILAGVHLFLYAQNVTLKYQLTELKLKLNELVDQNQQLASMVIEKENLAEVEKIAREKLNMIYPEKIIYLIDSKEANPKPK